MNKKTDLLRTILFFSWMWFVLLLTVSLLIPLPILSLKPLTSTRKKYIYGITTFWARHLNSCSGSKISVNGMENCPAQGGFCIIANHSSNFDIPLLLSVIPRSIGYRKTRDFSQSRTQACSEEVDPLFGIFNKQKVYNKKYE